MILKDCGRHFVPRSPHLWIQAPVSRKVDPKLSDESCLRRARACSLGLAFDSASTVVGAHATLAELDWVEIEVRT